MDRKLVSIQATSDDITKMMYFYESFSFPSPSPHVLVAYRVEGCTILIYKSKKVVFAGENARNEAKIWKPISLNNFVYSDNHAGSDETGTGDFFGPIIVVACYVHRADIPFLLELGVGDSKLIDDKRIREIAPQLIKRLAYSQLHLDNTRFNRLVDQGNFNMNKIKAYLHNQALTNLQAKVEETIPYYVIDQFAPKDLYFRYLEGISPLVTNLVFVTKGESASIAVACASIIARYSFIKRMDTLSKKVGVELPKGAGVQVDVVARRLYEEKGPKALEKIAKLNFKNYKKIQPLSK